MSRRKAGCTPRRVDPAPAATPGDEMEMPDLVIEVKPEPDARPLQAPGLGPFSPKEVPVPGRFEGEPRHSPGPGPAGGPLHALGARNPWALWTPLMPNSPGERPLPMPRAPPTSPFPLAWDPFLRAPTPGLPYFPGRVLAFSPFSDLRVSPLPRNPQPPSWPHPTLTTRFLPADRQPWTDKHPDLLTCGRCRQTFPLEAITAFMDHKKLGCQLLRDPSPCQGSGESGRDAVPLWS